MRIPLSRPDISEAEVQAVSEVLRTPHLSLGPKLQEFEHAFASFVGASNAIAVSSGTAGLHLCIRALGIGEGDEVIVPSFAFIAVANAVRYERATPVFADIERRTLNLNPSCIEALITPRTKAIIVVHTFGCPADLDSVLDVARRHHLLVIEDACEAIGSEYRGKKVGTFGELSVFGFYPNKQITTGEGGIVVTRSAAIANFVRKLRNQGRDPSLDLFQHTELGYNYRIPEISCALGLEQLKRIEPVLRRRAEIAESYNRLLSGNRHLKLPVLTQPLRTISWFAYVVQLEREFNESQRDTVVQEMARRGIGAGRYFAPIHLQPIYKTHIDREGLGVTETVAARTISLPFFNRIHEFEIEEVCKTLVDVVASSVHLKSSRQSA